MKVEGDSLDAPPPSDGDVEVTLHCSVSALSAAPAVTHDSTGRGGDTSEQSTSLSLTRQLTHTASAARHPVTKDPVWAPPGISRGKKARPQQSAEEKDAATPGPAPANSQMLSSTGLAKRGRVCLNRRFESHTTNTCQRWRAVAQWCPTPTAAEVRRSPGLFEDMCIERDLRTTTSTPPPPPPPPPDQWRSESQVETPPTRKQAFFLLLRLMVKNCFHANSTNRNGNLSLTVRIIVLD